MATTDKNYSTSFTFWQQNEDGLNETAIVVSRVNDGLSIQQETQSIYVSGNEVDDFCRLLKKVMKEKP